MKKYFFILLFIPVSSIGGIIMPGYFNLSTIGEINVIIGDNASGGCWTNLGEAKKYAEDKLTLAGAKLVDKERDINAIPISWGAAGFSINVNAVRDNQGWCIGYYSVEMSAYDSGREHLPPKQAKPGLMIYSRDVMYGSSQDNFNQQILDLINTSIKNWEAVELF